MVSSLHDKVVYDFFKTVLQLLKYWGSNYLLDLFVEHPKVGC